MSHAYYYNFINFNRKWTVNLYYKYSQASANLEGGQSLGCLTKSAGAT